MASDLDRMRSATLWLTRHSGTAIAEAHKMAAQFLVVGDRDAADAWLRVILAIETLLAPRTATH